MRGRDLSGETAESLAALIREEIQSGVLSAGTRLPSIREFVQQGASKWVAETALDRLRAEGLVEARHGSGSYVRADFTRIPRVVPGRLSRQQWGQGHAIQDHDTSPRPRTVDVFVEEVVPPADVAKMLGTGLRELVLSRSRRFVVDGRPVQLATSYLPTALTRGTAIEHMNTGPGGVYARLADRGFGPTRFREKIIARAPHPDEAAALELRRNAAVFEITRQAWAEGRCVEVTRMVLDVDAYELVMEFPA